MSASSVMFPFLKLRQALRFSKVQSHMACRCLAEQFHHTLRFLMTNFTSPMVILPMPVTGITVTTQLVDKPEPSVLFAVISPHPH